MTDSPNTDATAELAALEMDLLRKDVAFWIEQSDIWKRLANDERDITDRLRAVIGSAPHAAECEQWDLEPRTGRPLTDQCACWKADVL